MQVEEGIGFVKINFIQGSAQELGPEKNHIAQRILVETVKLPGSDLVRGRKGNGGLNGIEPGCPYRDVRIMPNTEGQFKKILLVGAKGQGFILKMILNPENMDIPVVGF